MGSTFGKLLKISIFGESHGPAIGMTLDGFPAGIKLDMEFIAYEMKRRAPSKASASTARREPDIPNILSGVLNGTTTGAPICAVIENKDAKSKDYASFKDIPRPGHADFTAELRYHGFQDASGGGHFSGRLTAPLTFAGALCKLALAHFEIKIGAHLLQVGDVFDDIMNELTLSSELLDHLRCSQYPIINPAAQEAMLKLVEETRNDGDSIGGVVECAVLGVLPGLGSPIFDAVESRLSAMLFSIPAVRGVEFGTGFGTSFMNGSEANDEFYIEDNCIKTRTNYHGGVLGGITTGMPIQFRTAFKPTPSIYKKQNTVNLLTRKSTTIEIKGRHDPCVAFRAVPVVEAATAFVVLDLVLEAYGYENIR